jgi:ribokinase
VVNEHEAAVLAARLGCATTPTALRQMLGVDIAVTLGEAGVAAETADGPIRLPAFPVTPVDTTGAGDCWCGVLCAGLDRGLSLPAAMRRAGAAAAIACTRPGAAASMPMRTETDALAGA